MAYVEHRDVDLENVETGIKEHDFDGEMETEFDSHAFDSQFHRYAQVLDTDYDNYMVLF